MEYKTVASILFLFSALLISLVLSEIPFLKSHAKSHLPNIEGLTIKNAAKSNDSPTTTPIPLPVTPTMIPIPLPVTPTTIPSLLPVTPTMIPSLLPVTSTIMPARLPVFPTMTPSPLLVSPTMPEGDTPNFMLLDPSVATQAPLFVPSLFVSTQAPTMASTFYPTNTPRSLL